MDGFLLCLPALAALVAAFCGPGGLLLRGGSWPERLGAGALLVSMAVSAAGWLSALSSAVLWAILAVAAASAAFGARRRPSPGGLLPAAIALLILFPLAAMPPMARDAMNHHLYLPRLWLEAGGIHRPAWCPFFYYPYMVESLYALVGGTFGFRASNMVSLLGFAGSIGAAWHAAEPHGRKASLLASLVVLSVPEALRNATWAYSDSFLLLFSILAAGELAKDRWNPSLAALWAAAAGACKYNGLPVTAAVLLVIAWRFRRSPVRLAAPLAVAMLVSAAWALPNAIERSNPVHPLMGGLFGTEPEVMQRTQELLAGASAYSASVSGPSDLVMLPLRMSLQGRWDDPRLYDGASGPLLLAGVLLFAVLGRRKVSALPALAVFVATVLLSGSAARVRYLFGAIGMLSIPAGEGLSRAMSSGRTGRAVTLAATTVCLIWSGSRLFDLYGVERPWEALDDSFLENRLPYMSFYMEADRVLEENDTTLFVNMGNRAFYWPSCAVFNARRFPLDVLEPLWAGLGAEGLDSILRARGVTHVAVDMDIADINISGELTEEEFAEWREFAALWMEPVVSEGPYVLFRLAE
ncbi:MAG TPA: hypothetical protein PLV86_00365 [Candidatus Fermentibacter daniensis]|jgi:hypothetical protein|nr:MAG: hypothetical protein AO396_05190 [Candidatus Fermentibacter daniensis]MBP7719884.1 hypothetical protein [Candidatus Fermentibacter sp.]KZD17420.1 MAG: hypothetical protein AO394_05625 [Candidatus Fermentibacter daniensis]KZD17896.1 MAG: hypothetical protein AO395_01445 [Candidatus Fermentibacter daniensis]MCC6871449.1 hypothetical protein [Candidatus Fermentibacter sp.]